MTYTEEGKAITDELDDYRPVNGVQFAFKSKHSSEIQKVDVTIKSIVVNPPLKPELFK
jgi:hypothetical protein